MKMVGTQFVVTFLAPLPNPEPNSDGMYGFNCHIDAIYIPTERKGFP